MPLIGNELDQYEETHQVVLVGYSVEAMFTALSKFVNRRCIRNASRDRDGFPRETVFNSACRLAVAIALASILLNPLKVSGQDVAVTDRIEKAATLIRDNRIEEAELLLNSVLRIRPQDAAALDLLGTIRAKQGKLNEAESLFTRAIKNDAQLIGAHMNLAYLYLLKGVHEKTASELREVLRLDPRNADASYRLAWLLLSQGQVDECINTIAEFRKSQPPSASLLAILGDAYLKKDSLDKAEESYRLALNESLTNTEATLGLATIFRKRGDANSAILYLGHAKRMIGDSPDLLYRFALIAISVQLGDDAIIALKRAIELSPKESSYYFVLGIAWLTKPDLQEAEQVFRQFLKLQPDNAQGQTYLGYVLLKEKSYPEAREWLERSIKKDAATPETFYYLGLIAQEQKEDDRAVGLFEKSIQLSPSFAHSHIALGSTYLKMKDYLRAQQELEIGVRLNPDDSKAHYNLALLYARLNDSQRAQDEMQIVERLKSSKGPAESDAVTPPRPPRRL
jgi:tetratricopeptide (TPR) repeat protein